MRYQLLLIVLFAAIIHSAPSADRMTKVPVIYYLIFRDMVQILIQVYIQAILI